jgi:prepilin-type N-terminal cleavage/methylation domain-containing protein
MSRFVKTSNRSRSAGFTLLEVLATLLILSVALGVLWPSFSGGFASLDRSAFHAMALAEARSQLDRLGSEVPLTEGELTGVSERGLSWTIRLLREGDAPSGPLSEEFGNALVIPYEVEVIVSDAAGQRLSIKTLRLATVEQGVR